MYSKLPDAGHNYYAYFGVFCIGSSENVAGALEAIAEHSILSTRKLDSYVVAYWDDTQDALVDLTRDEICGFTLN